MEVRFLLDIIIYSIILTTTLASNKVPNAEVLDEILARHLNYTEFDGSVFGYLFGNYSEAPTDINIENLDVSTLDIESIQKIINGIKRKYQDNVKSYRRSEPLFDNKVFVEKAFDLMKQSIYSTRYRMLETKPFRDKYKNNISYNIAIMYGAIMQIKTKMENIYATMINFPVKTHFLWHLVLYEKSLACYVDIEQMVDKIFMLHESNIETLNPEADYKEMPEDIKRPPRTDEPANLATPPRIPQD